MTADPTDTGIPADAPVRRAGGRWLMLFMFFLSGVAALVYQIVWTKELALVFGITIYATSAVVTSYMAGLALGSLFFGRVVDRWKRPMLLFALLELGIFAFAALFPLILRGLEKIYVLAYGPLGDSHYSRARGSWEARSRDSTRSTTSALSSGAWPPVTSSSSSSGCAARWCSPPR
jgi:MFS family permease